MSNPMKYIKNLEAVGFQREQAEAQVQMVLDAIEGDLATKSDIALLKSDMDIRWEQIRREMDIRWERMENRFMQFQQQLQSQIKESEFRLTTRLGFLTVSVVSIAVAVLAWLIKI